MPENQEELDRPPLSEAEMEAVRKTSLAQLDRKIETPVDLEKALAEKVPESREVMTRVKTFHPIRDKVMVRRLAEDSMTLKGTLYIPDDGKEKPIVGVVLAVGRGRLDAAGVFQPCEVQEGDVVLFGRYDGREYMVNGETVMVMSESCISGVLR